MEGLGVVALALGFGVFMPLIIGFFSYKEKQLKLQREIAMHGGEELRRELASTVAELERMRGRMAVLERVVTSDDRRLADEIERLGRKDVRPGAGA